MNLYSDSTISSRFSNDCSQTPEHSKPHRAIGDQAEPEIPLVIHENQCLTSVRCREKACVFPAADDTTGLCLYHKRFRREPDHFSSLQPTLLVIVQSTFNLPDYESGHARAQDRRRLEAQRKAFQEGLA
jgi:hypothetical protein